MSDDAGSRADPFDTPIVTEARVRRARRGDTWALFLTAAVLASVLRVAAGAAAWAPLLDAAWGLICTTALAQAAHRDHGRGRLAWSLFAASVACGSASMALFPAAVDDATVRVLRDVLDLGAYGFGATGLLALVRRVGTADPDAWLDAAAIGLALSLVMFEFVLEHQTPELATGRDTWYSVLVAAVNAAIFTTLARFVVRPIARPSLAMLGAIVAVVLVLDVAYYTTLGMERHLYEALWFLGYGAWAAGGLHPDAPRLIRPSTGGPPSAEQVVRSAFASIAIHSAGFMATVVVIWNHLSTTPGENPLVFLGAFGGQTVLVSARSIRLVSRLARDDAARRSAEQALRSSEERFRRLAEVAPVGIFVADLEGRSVFQNRSWGQVAGMPAEAGLEWGYEQSIHPDDRPWAMARWLDTVRTHATFDIDHRILRPDGDVGWVHATATLLSDADGEPAGWVGTVSDITGLVSARQTALEREAFISGLIEQAPVGIEIYDSDGRSVSANCAQRAIRALVAPDQQPAVDVRSDPLMLRLGQHEAIAGAFAGRASGDREPVRVEPPHGDAPPPDVWARLTWFPLLDHGGRVTAVISFLEDVSPAVHADQERRAVEEKLREAAKLEALGVLAGGIAHDFNNLLVAILGHANLAREQLLPGSRLDNDLAAVETAARRAADLARQMLAYSGRGSLRVGAVDVGGLLREMGDLLARSIAKSAAIRHEYAPGLPPVLADATQLRQVALNLIVNASDALGDRPGTITLRTALVTLDGDDPDIVPGTPAAPGEYVLLEVVDTGRGMDAATRARIFDPFFTTKTTGRGLGLAATLGIVKGHGGAIRVRSQAGSGTTIGVLLRPAAVPASGPDRRAPAPWTGAAPVPLPAADGTTATATPTAAEGLARDADTPSLGRILIVDDEPTVRTLGRRVLERAGYTVTEAGDGPEGIEAFADDPASWAGVLLDLTLPTLDGMVVLAEVRRLRPGIPAVICSGWAAEEVTERLAEMPGTLVLEKPYAASALVEAFRVSIAAGGHG